MLERPADWDILYKAWEEHCRGCSQCNGSAARIGGGCREVCAQGAPLQAAAFAAAVRYMKEPEKWMKKPEENKGE